MDVWEAAAIAMALAAAWMWWNTQRNLPPGPRGWPVVGSLGLLGTHPHQALRKLSIQYGPLMFMKLGSVQTLVVSSQEMAMAILKTHDRFFCSRPQLSVGEILFYNRQDIGFSHYGPYWSHLRRICSLELLSSKRMQTFQRERMEEMMSTVRYMLEQKDSIVDVRTVVFRTMTNNITRMAMSKSYFGYQSGNEQEMNSFRDMIQETFELLGVFNISDYFPYLNVFDLQGYQARMKKAMATMDKYFQNIVDEHRDKLNKTSIQADSSNVSPENFVEVLLRLPGFQLDGETTSTELPDKTIKAILNDMIHAGTDTTTVVVEWTLSELLRKPLLLRKVQEELNSVVGPHRIVKESDLPKLFYLEAVIKESLRLHPPGVLLIPRESMEACRVAGYDIPAKTRVFVNAWAIGRDAATWTDPEEFIPERFMGSSVDVKGQNFQLLPFGSGRRICPGMNLGLLMVQLTLAQFLHCLDWSLPEGQTAETLDMSEVFGLNVPRAFPLKAVVSPRLPPLLFLP